MTKCTSCGKDHGMVIEDMTTGETTPIDWCKECFFSKGYTYKEPESVHLCQDWSFEGLREKLRENEDRIIKDMIVFSEVPIEIADGSM